MLSLRTLRLHYNDQPVIALSRNNLSLLLETYVCNLQTKGKVKPSIMYGHVIDIQSTVVQISEVVKKGKWYSSGPLTLALFKCSSRQITGHPE